MDDKEIILKVDERPAASQWLGLSFQHLFAMFGSTVLVPIIVGINPAVALLSSGLGTLAHMSVTRFKVPAYMGSSFAYIAALSMLMKHGGMPAIAQGAIVGGLVYLIVALIVHFAGRDWINKVLPPIVVGPIVMVIGLSLASTAIGDSMYRDPSALTGYSLVYLAIALITVLSIVIYNIYGKGFVAVIPILLGIIMGYVAALILGAVTHEQIVNLSGIASAPWFSTDAVTFPMFREMFSDSFRIYPTAILTITPIAFVTMTEHFGHLMVLNSLTKRDYFENPGLDKTLTGDGVAQILAGILGAPPVTSYGENIGVMAISRIHSIYVIAGAAVLAVIVSFIGKVSAILLSVPTPVIGGASIALFGVIASNGLKILIENKVNFDVKRNLLISSVVLVVGIGGMVLDITQNLQVSSVAIATILGIALHLILPKDETEEAQA